MEIYTLQMILMQVEILMQMETLVQVVMLILQEMCMLVARKSVVQ